MRVRTTYIVIPGNALIDADLPIEVTIEDVTLSLGRDERDELRLVVERPVDRSALELVADSGVFRRREDGTEVPIPAVRVPESALDAVAARDVLSALSFLSGTPLTMSVRRSAVDDDVVPDNPDDEALLERLGTRQRYRQTSPRPRHAR
jgi:hypothetical protein